MRRLSYLTLLFALLTLLFVNLLVYLRFDFAWYQLMSYQDALDLVTPVVLIPVYWLLFRECSACRSTVAEEVALMVFAALWVVGQGMHLSANSVNNLIEGLAEAGVMDITASQVYELSYFYDEHLSHVVWHLGMIGLAGLLIYREWQHPAGQRPTWWATGLAGLIYGFTLFTVYLEGQTVVLGFAFALFVATIGLVWGRRRLAVQPVLAFFVIACLLACVLFTGWGFYWGGFPQLTEVGLI
jgi:hypothetical protein